MKKLLILVLLLTSCSSMKRAELSDNSKTDRVSETRKTTRQGDTVTMFVPNVKYRDTTITRTNYATNTVLTTKYDSQGNQTIDCISGKIEELIQTMRETQQNDINSSNEQKRDFNPQYFLYGLGFLGLVLIGMVFMIMRLQKSIPTMVKRLMDDKA